MNFEVFIDESGETGISKVRDEGTPGASPYFVLGAVVCEPTAVVHLDNAIDEFKNTIKKKKWKHATDLGHSEKALLARELSRLPVRYFAVISKKTTLGEYKKSISDDPQKYYNKCLKYLLESIFAYISPLISSAEDVTIVLEERRHDYDAMIRYLTKVKNNPIYKQSKPLALLNPFSISRKKKGEVTALEVADFVAHSVYQCTNKSPSNYFIPEPRYLSEIRPRFGASKDGSVLGVGIKCIHSLRELELDPDIEVLLTKMKAPPPR